MSPEERSRRGSRQTRTHQRLVETDTQSFATTKQLNQRELSAIKNMHASLGIDVELGLEAGMETSCGLVPPKTSFRHATGFVIDRS